MQRKVAENRGDITQDNIIPLTPPTYGNVSLVSYHITHCAPFNAIVIPIIPPTHECVVETGISYFDAKNNQAPTENKPTYIHT